MKPEREPPQAPQQQQQQDPPLPQQQELPAPQQQQQQDQPAPQQQQTQAAAAAEAKPLAPRLKKGDLKAKWRLYNPLAGGGPAAGRRATQATGVSGPAAAQGTGSQGATAPAALGVVPGVLESSGAGTAPATGSTGQRQWLLQQPLPPMVGEAALLSKWDIPGHEWEATGCISRPVPLRPGEKRVRPRSLFCHGCSCCGGCCVGAYEDGPLPGGKRGMRCVSALLCLCCCLLPADSEPHHWGGACGRHGAHL